MRRTTRAPGLIAVAAADAVLVTPAESTWTQS